MKLENIEETFESAVQNHKKNNFKIAEKLYKKILISKMKIYEDYNLNVKLFFI